MAAALVVAAIVALGSFFANPGTALAADDDGSSSVTADIVLVAPGSAAADNGSPAAKDGTSRAGAPATGDAITWLPLLGLATAAALVAAYARRRSLAAEGASTRARHLGSQQRPAARGRHVAQAASASARTSATTTRARTSAAHATTSRTARTRSTRTPNWPAISRIALAVVLAALAASTAMVLSARAAGSDLIRIEMQQSDDGTWTGTTTYYVDNDATYFRDLAKITEKAESGFNLADGSVTITISPASAPDVTIASEDAVKGAATAGGSLWRVPGSAVSDTHNMALKVTATAKALDPGDNAVGSATFDLTAPVYEDLMVRLSTSPAVGKPLAASMAGAPAEAANAFAYTWLVSDDGESWTVIEGATGATFTPTAGMAGSFIAVQLDCDNPAWFRVVPSEYQAPAPICEAPAAGDNAHVVIFDVDGHGDAPEAQIVSDGDCAVRPADPAASGYTFLGWFADEARTVPYIFPVSPITADTVVYGAWGTGDAAGAYALVYLLQDADDDSLYNEEEREVKAGTFSGELSDVTKSYTGFTPVRIEKDEAADDAVWLVYYDRIMYTVRFHVDGEIVSTEQVRYEDLATEPNDKPQLPGRTFKHWSLANSTDPYDFSTKVTGDVDLYAQFEMAPLTVTFETWGQASVPDQTVQYGKLATMPTSPSVSDALDPQFQGWFVDPDLTIPFDFTAPILQDTTVYAKYFPQVLFVLQGKAADVSVPVKWNGGINISTADPATSVTPAAAGDAVPATISAPGYRITGWYEDSNCSGSPVTSYASLQENKTLYASFEAISYKVRFLPNDGDGTMADQTFTFDQEQALSANAFHRAGYDFAGWNTKADGTGTAYTDQQSVKNLADTADAVVELYAQWTPASDTEYTVKHLIQDASDDTKFTEDVSAAQVLKGVTGAKTAAAAKSFPGLAAQAIEQQTIAADNSTVVEIKYVRTPYTVKFDLNGVAGTAPDDQTVKYGGSVTKPADPTAADGYQFAGWFTDPACNENDKWDFASDTVEGDMTLYAKWEGAKLTVKFDANVVSGETATGTMDDQEAQIGGTVTLAENKFERDGYTFVGWNTNADGSGTSIADKATVAAATLNPSLANEVTLYAQWVGKSVAYKVTHLCEDDNGQFTITNGTDDALSGTAGATTAAAARTIEGYDADTIEQKTIAGDGSTVVEVRYKLKEYTVTFETWGFAEPKPSKTVKVKHGQKATAATVEVSGSGTGSTFQGWYDSYSLTNLFDFDTPITKDTTVYSLFKPDVVIIFGGTADPVPNISMPAKLNDTFTMPAASQVTPPGYKIENEKFYWESSYTNEVPASFKVDTELSYLDVNNQRVPVYAKLVPANDTAYKVEHYQQSLASAIANKTDAADYSLVDTENLTGTTGANTAAAPKSYEGFTCVGSEPGASGSITQQTIAPDGSTVVKVYYNRNSDTAYEVRHWQQNLDGTYPNTSTEQAKETENKTGFTGDTTEAAAKTFPGFTAKAFTQKTIAGNGGTKVDIFYDRDKITVTFNMQGHGAAPAAQTILAGGTATKPADPTDTKYEFKGWYTSDELTEAFDFSKALTEDTVVFAKWEVKQYEVAFQVNDASMADTPATQKVEHGKKADDPGNVAKTGFKLVGWFKDAEHTLLFDFLTEAITKSITVYGQFEAMTYTVSYADPDGNRSVPAAQTKTHDVDITLSTDGAPASYDAKKLNESFEVTYNGNGGTVGYVDDSNTKCGPLYHYEFKGWGKTRGGSVDYQPGDTFAENADTVLYAQYDESLKTAAQPVTLPDATKTNYILLGWYTQSSGGTKVGNAGDEYLPTSSVKLYAHWVAKSSAYVIHYNPTGYASGTQSSGWGYTGEGTMSTQVVDMTQGFTIDECKYTAPSSDPDLKFLGWNTKQDGTGRWVLPDENIAANEATMKSTFSRTTSTSNYEVTLYAQWSHLTGLTAATLADDASYSKYSKYVGELWIPCNDDGSYDRLRNMTTPTEVGEVLLCRLVAAGEDGDNMLTFFSDRVMPKWIKETGHADWKSSVTRNAINKGGTLYNMMPASLIADGIVKEVPRSYHNGGLTANIWTTSDYFWVPCFGNVYGNPYGINFKVFDGPRYQYFIKHGYTEFDLSFCRPNTYTYQTTSSSGEYGQGYMSACMSMIATRQNNKTTGWATHYMEFKDGANMTGNTSNDTTKTLMLHVNPCFCL